MLPRSPPRLILLAATVIVSLPTLLLSSPIKLPMPRQWEGSRIEQGELKQSIRILKNVWKSPTPTLSNVSVPVISNSSSSNYENKIENHATNLKDEMTMSTSENRHMFHWMLSQKSSDIGAWFSWMRNYVMRMKHDVGRVPNMLSFGDHSRPASRSTMLRRPNHDVKSRFIFSHDKENNRRKKTVYENSKPPLNSAIFQRDAEDSNFRKLETFEPFDFVDHEKNHAMSTGRKNFAEDRPTTASLPNIEAFGIGPSLSVSNYLKTTGAKYIAAAPCGSSRFWLPTVLRTLEREGFRLVLYCVEIGVSEAEAQQSRTAFSGLSSAKFGGFINTNLDDIDGAIPRNIDVVISWFGIRSWGVRKGLRFLKALQRSGVKRAVFTSMCSNPDDEVDKPWTESDSRVTSFWENKVDRSRRINLNDCSQLLVYSLN